MCDILRRLNSPVLTKQQYLSYLNEFSRICRNKGKELFLIEETIHSTKSENDTGDNESINPIFLLNRNVEKDNYTMDDVFTCLKTALFHDAAEVRAAALRAIRYLLIDEISVKSLLRINLPIYIVRSIDIVLENRIERIQALRLVRKFLSISPRLFPSAFTRSLVAIAQDGLDEHDTLTRACWALLAELTIMCPKSSTRDTQNNAFNAIMDATLSGNQPHGMCESLISTLLYMLNWPKYRCLIRGETDLQIFVAPFTDSHYSAPAIKNQKQGLNQSAKFDVDPYDQREHKFNAAKITLISILRSWQGLIYLCEPQECEANLVTKSCLKSLINMLYLPYNDVRKRLIDLLFELLYLPSPDSTLDFDSGLKFLEKHQLSKDSWKIHDAFIVDEARALLTPMRTRIRMNLLNDYMALLLLALFQCNVVDALSEVIITPFSQENSNRATILLYELLSLSYQYLPTDSFSQYLTLSTLIAHATSKADDSRDLANAALINLGRIRPSRKPLRHTDTKHSVFLAQLLEFCSPQTGVTYSQLDETSNSNDYNIRNDIDVNDSSDNNPSSATCNSITNTLTINSMSTIISNQSNLSRPRSNSSTNSSTLTSVNLRGQQINYQSRSPSISSRSPSILSKASTLVNTASLFTIFSFSSASKTNLKTMAEQKWQSWDWEYINFTLSRPCGDLKRLSSYYYRTFIKRLVQFYKPSSNQYSMIDINNECKGQLCDTGCKLIDFLLDCSEVKATELLEELLHDISISMQDPENTYNMNLSTKMVSSSPKQQQSNINNQQQTSRQQPSTPQTALTNDKISSANQPPIIFPTHLNHAATLSPTAHNLSQQQSEINILSSTKLISTLSSTYFLFIGRLSSTEKGFQLLEKTSIMNRINDLSRPSKPSSSPAEVYVRLIISCFDYTKEYNGSRKLLEKFLFDHPEESVRLYATNFLRVLLRTNVQDYSTWGMELLVKQLCSSMRVIHFAAADILDEACDLDCHLEGLIALKAVVNPLTKTEKSVFEILRSSNDVGIILLCRFASSPNGLRYLIETPRQCLSVPLDAVLQSTKSTKENGLDNISHINTTTTDDIIDQPSSSTTVAGSDSPLRVQIESEFDVELNRWRDHFNYRYVKIVEDVLNDSLTYHQKGEDGKYGRRIDRINPMTKNSYIPPHLYSQLAQHSEGIEIMLAQTLLDPVIAILKHPPDDLNFSEVSLLKFKAALWIIGHVGSTSLGYQLFENSREILRLITKIARDCLVLSLRGTAFYVIGLLGSTAEGAEELKEFGWIVQSDDIIALPVSLDLILTKPKDDDGNLKKPFIIQFDQTELDNEERRQLQQVTRGSKPKIELPSKPTSPSSSSPPNIESNYDETDGLPPLHNEGKRLETEEQQSKQKQQRPKQLLGGATPTATKSSENIPTKVASRTTLPTSMSSNSLTIHAAHNMSAQKSIELLNKYSEDELEQIRKDIMKHVANLSGQLAYRTAENSLLEFKRKYGDLFQYDGTLYSQVCHQLARSNFRLQARRFLQELFLDTVG